MRPDLYDGPRCPSCGGDHWPEPDRFKIAPGQVVRRVAAVLGIISALALAGASRYNGF